MTTQIPAGRSLTYADPLTLPRLAEAEALAGGLTGALLPDAAPRRFRRIGPAFVDNPDAVPGFEHLVDMDVEYPPVFMASAPGGELVGYRTTVAAEGRFFVDDAPAPGERAGWLARLARTEDAFLNEDTGLRPGPALDAFVLPDAPAERLAGRVVSLASHEPSNYGSFLFRVLPKVRMLRDLGLDREQLLVYPQSLAATELLEMAGLRPARLVAHDPRLRWRADHLLIPSMRNNQALLDPETLALLDGLRGRFGAPRDPRLRLYVSRRSHNASVSPLRAMRNEAELEARLERIGFRIVSPERRTMREQIELFSAAAAVVGPSGSGMFNAMFCRPGTKLVDIESEPHWLHAHMCLFGSAGLDYGIFVGRPEADDPAPVHKRWRADLDALVERVAAFVGA